MTETNVQWEKMREVLQSIRSEIQQQNILLGQAGNLITGLQYVHVPFRGSEIYLLHKAFIDAGGAPNENYKTLLEKTVNSLANRTQKGFSAQSFCKYSDKVDPEAKDNVKRFLQKMIRNIDSYD
ncbi:MAG TPA: hypothetical protein PKC72_13165 [Chitinophagaceae bacterium]|nr:hypothetical protein [Chitinophagaceae bacterium]